MKNIVLLSDGTGNSAAKRHRTNVWHLYEALDLHRQDQIAFYDDGVGSKEFVFFKLLAGVFGWGVKNNVIELYKTLCRNYKCGDNIYLFGFSRGAFTVRVLAAMIASSGLYTRYADEDDLRRIALGNFRAYRAMNKRGWINRGFRWLVRWLLAWKDSEKGVKGCTKPEIEFIGAWDTVAAYGLPVDELAMLWDRWIFPLRLINRKLPCNVKRACHALSIDDERQTFHPVLWDERCDEKNRIEQVWFAGAHSDVGGGYPMNRLALVTLDWMISKVEAKSKNKPGLHFNPTIREEYRRNSDWHGMQHDSRAGIGAYYRYKPREIESLCNDCENRVIIAKPKIHQGVLERIKHNVVPYAPTALPASYDVVTTRPGAPPQYESSVDAKARACSMRAARAVVFRRRWLYAAFVAATVAFVLSPWLFSWSTGGACVGLACIVEPPLALVIDMLPGLAEPWIEVLLQSPWWLATVVIAPFVLSYLKSKWVRGTQTRAIGAWGKVKGLKGVQTVSRLDILIARFRGLLRSRWPRLLVRWALPTALFILIVGLLVRTADRTVLSSRAAVGSLCLPNAATELEGEGVVSVQIDNPCFGTGIKLKKGVVYRFEVEALKETWKYGGEEANADGVGSPTLLHFAGIPFRRHIAEPWLMLMGRVGQGRRETFAIGSGPTDYEAKSTGELFLYVNDAAFGLAPSHYWAWPYWSSWGRSAGHATVKVRACDTCTGV